MKEFPEGSGKMVVDEVAHQRLHPGGAVMDMKKFEVRLNSNDQDFLRWCTITSAIRSIPNF